MANITINNLFNDGENDSQNRSESIISIDEHGRVVIKDAELAQMSNELTPEELGCIVGGKGGLNIICFHF